MGNTNPFGEITGEKLEVLLDGERVQVFDWDKDRAATRQTARFDVKFPAKAGPHTVVRHVPGHQLRARQRPERALPAQHHRNRRPPGLRFFPHVGKMGIDGPYQCQGRQRYRQPPQDFRLPARQLRPGNRVRASRSSSTLARHAFRRPVTDRTPKC